MSTMLLTVTTAGHRAALPAMDVKAVIERPSVTPVPCAPSHVVGLAALRSRPLTVIDCSAVIDPRCTEAGHGQAARAVVVEHEGHLYALLVEAADAIVETRGELQPLGTDPRAGWGHVALGWIETEGGALPLLSPAQLIAGQSA